MSTNISCGAMAAKNFYAVSIETLHRTIEESEIDYSIDMGSFIVHHGTRDNTPIVIAEHKNQQANELSGVWFAE